MKKTSKLIALVLALVMLCNCFSGCTIIAASLASESDSPEASKLVLLGLVFDMILVTGIIVEIIKASVVVAPTDSTTPSLASADNAFRNTIDALPQTQIDALTLKVQAMPNVEMFSLYETFNTMPQTERSFFMDKLNAVSEVELLDTVENLNSLSDMQFAVLLNGVH